MKRVLFLSTVLLAASLPVSAKNVNNLYVVKQAKMDNYISQLSHKLEQATVKDSAIYSNSDKFYYIKLYADNDNLNVFLSCDKENQEEFANIIKSLDYKTFSFEDKDLTKKYSSDFKQFITSNNIKIEGVKIKEEDNVYNPYNKRLKNRIIKTVKYQENGIDFVANKMQMKSKIKKYVNGFEIIVTNNTGNDILLKKVSTGDFMGLTEIAKKAAMPQGIDFVPVYGIIAGAKTDLEKNRFSRPFPTNYTIKNGESVRLLGMAKHLVEPIIDFSFEINGKEKNIQLQTYQ